MNATYRRAILWGLVLAAALHAAPGARSQPPVDKVIGAITIKNNRLQSNQQILSQIHMRPGQKYSQVEAQEDVRRLMATKWFSNVQIETQLTPDGRVNVFIGVTELPNRIQDIVYRGADHINMDELTRMTGLRRGEALNPQANQSAVQALLRHYQEKGRLWASVDLVEGDKPSDTRVVFNVTEGPVARISTIDFVGNQFIGAERLRQQINSSRSRIGFGGVYNAVQVEFDCRRLVEYYQGLGFLGVRVAKEVSIEDAARTVRVIFHIEEGPQYKVRHLQLDFPRGQRSFDDKQLLSLTDLRPDSDYKKAVIQADLQRIKDFYGYRGYDVRLNEQHFLREDAPGEVTVHYEIVQRPPVRVGEIKVYGNTVTRDNVIRRNIPLYPGQILTYPDLLVAESNLARLGIFEVNPGEGVRPTVTVENPEVDEPFKNILVHVKEQPTGSLMLGLGVNSDAGLSGSIVFNERNFDILNPPTSFEEILAGKAWRGAGQEFRLEAVPGTIFQRYTATFREPSLLDSPYSLTSSAYFFSRSFAEYNENRVGGRFTLGRRLNQYWTVNLTSRIENVEVLDVPLFAPWDIAKDAGHSFIFGNRLGVTRDTRDSYLRPTRGSIIDAGVEEVVGDYTFPIGTVEATRYFTTFKRVDGSGKHVLAMRTQATFLGSNAPVFERVYGGGFRSIRGFSFRGVGPYQFGYNVGGDFAWLNSIEYQVPVLANDKFYFVTFLDSGTVERSIDIKDYRVSAGLGVRMVVPMLGPVPIALDFGFPIVQGPGDHRQVFSFWLGFFN